MSTTRTCQADEYGHLLYRWTDLDGQEWACCAYDHGPMCRLCRQVADEIESGCLDNVEKGHFYVRALPNGEFEFKMTEAGKAAAAALIESDPEAQQLYDQATTAAIEEAETISSWDERCPDCGGHLILDPACGVIHQSAQDQFRENRD